MGVNYCIDRSYILDAK